MKHNILSNRFYNDGSISEQLNDVQIKWLELFKKESLEIELSVCNCGSEDFEVIAQKDRYGIEMNTVICKKCGLVMTNPHMTQKSYDLFYDKFYNYIYRGESCASEETWAEQKNRGKRIKTFIESCLGQEISGKRILEIGCSTGGILSEFDNNSVCGIDLSEEYVNFGRRKGLNLKCCTTRDLVLEKEKFDIIILSHVLEHFLDLDKEIDIIWRLLKDDGVVYIAVPGIKNVVSAYNNDFLLLLQNAHVYNFTRTTLHNVMSKNKFDMIYATEEIQGLFKKGCELQFHNGYEEIVSFIKESEKLFAQPKEMLYSRLWKKIADYKPGEIAIYGIGNETKKMIEAIPDLLSRIKCFVSYQEDAAQFEGKPIVDIEMLNGVKCIVIPSLIYRERIYFRIAELMMLRPSQPDLKLA